MTKQLSGIREALLSLLRLIPGVRPLLDAYHHRRLLKEWEAQGRPVPPPDLYKRKVIREYAKKFSLASMVETGTFYGETINAVKDHFRQIFSIELDDALHEQAKVKFQSYPHIHLLKGDSGEVLPQMLSQIQYPCLFWLDGHYSCGVTAKGSLNTPIRKELDAIFNLMKQPYVILIDDARDFKGHEDYPTTEELRQVVLKAHPDWIFEVKDDMIRIHPRTL